MVKTKIRCLGSILTKDPRYKETIKTWPKCLIKKILLFSSIMYLEMRKWLVTCHVCCVLIYRCETWTMGRGDRNRIEDFEMWVWRKIEII